MASANTDNGVQLRNDETLNEPLLHNRQDESDRIHKNITFPHWLTCRKRQDPPASLNQNVALNLLLCVLYGVSDSLWSGTVIAAYLKRLGHNTNTPVGNVEAANGLAGLFSALPVGYCADKIGRAKVIRAGGVLLLITAILHILLLEWIGVDDKASHKHVFWLLGAIMSLWGIAGGVVSGPAQALYADSTPGGARSKYYMYLFATYILSSCVGPLVSIILFQTLGDEWDLYHLRMVLYVGLGIELVNAIVMMFFDDRKALDESDNADERTENTQDEEVAPDQVVEQADINSDETEQDIRLKERRKWIPYITLCQGFIFAIGSGMTVKFFPLFFKDEVGMSPTQVQIIYVLVPIAMTAFSGVGQKLASTGFGRVQSAIVLNTAGVSMLYSMVFFKSFLDKHPFALVPIYILRTALMNCTYPLQESILMDFVPKNERARWKSLDSIAQFGWCGSAALGGFLTDKYDYSYTFFITASLQLTGILVYSLLLPLVPRREQDLARGSNNESSAVVEHDKPAENGTLNHTTQAPDSLEEPLLDNQS